MTDDTGRNGLADHSLRGVSSDYSRIAARYDATRELPVAKLNACYDRLVEQQLFPASGSILDVGCGTGQVSLSLAAKGYEVTGIDISAPMIALARSKLHPAWRARYLVGDARCIDAADKSFDAAVVSKLLQHVQDWRQVCRELVRVVRPGGLIVQINERGAFGNAVRRTFARKADERGFGARYPGLDPHGGGELAAFMLATGCASPAVDMSDLLWTVAITYEEALRRIHDRLFAEFWPLPTDVHDALEAENAGLD